jgi:hypothetical protein
MLERRRSGAGGPTFFLESDMVTGSCVCGKVRYEASGPFSSMLSCHCSMCRKHHGTAFATYVSTPIDNFHWLQGKDGLIEYKSSEQGVRNSCSVCGSTVPMMMPALSMAFLPAGPLEGDLGMRPQGHIFVGSKAPWHTITDDLPQHDEYPAELGVTGLERPRIESQPPGVASGSCLCGAVAYEATGEPAFMQSCHCQRCRRVRAAAHGTNIFYKAAEFRWIRGDERVAEYKLPDARFYTAAFCRQCGGAVPKVALDRGMAIIPAGSLDTDPPMRPQRHIFTNYKASWFEITDAIPQFPEGPPPPPATPR